MTETFVDTVAWIALLNTRDSLHEPSNATFHRLRQNQHRLVTTEYVLLELASTLSSVAFRGKVSTLIAGFKQDAAVVIVPSESELFSSGFQIYRDRPDKEWSLVDCTSFVVMQRRSIADAFTTDRHFTQGGFKVLL